MNTQPDSSLDHFRDDIYSAPAIIMDAQLVVSMIEAAMKANLWEMLLNMQSWSALMRLSELPRHIRDEIDAQAAGELCLSEEILAQALLYCSETFAQEQATFDAANRLYESARQIRILIRAYHIVR